MNPKNVHTSAAKATVFGIWTARLKPCPTQKPYPAHRKAVLFLKHLGSSFWMGGKSYDKADSSPKNSFLWSVVARSEPLFVRIDHRQQRRGQQDSPEWNHEA